MSFLLPQQMLDTLQETGQVDVVWLYGSRAKGNESPGSDYDLAVAFTNESADAANSLQDLDDLQFSLANVGADPVSVVDINRIPVPLAINIVNDGRVVLCKSDIRLRLEQQRIWSLWEEYKTEHERNRKAL